MKKLLKLALIYLISISSFSQSVTIEPTLSGFVGNNVEIHGNSDSSTPLKLFSNSQYNFLRFYTAGGEEQGQIFADAGIFGINGIGKTTINVNNSPRLTVNSGGNIGIGNNYDGDTYKLSVKSSNSSIASFLNEDPNANININYQNKHFLQVSPTKATYYGAVDFEFQANNTIDLQTNGTSRLFLGGNQGNVGIGTTTPSEKLDVNGNIKAKGLSVGNNNLVLGDYSVAFGNQTFALSKSSLSIGEFNDISDSPDGANSGVTDRVFQIGNGSSDLLRSNALTVLRNGKTGIGVLAPTSKLEVNGDIKSTELGFIGTTDRRPVFADKDGILKVDNTSNHYLSYNFTSVLQQNHDDQLIRGSGFAWFNTTTSPKTMYLPVNLPDGVKVTNVKLYLRDNSASNMSFELNSFSHTVNAFLPLASATSSGSNAAIVNINSNISTIVDNLNNSYYINISSVGNWTGNSLLFHSLVITYQYQ